MEVDSQTLATWISVLLVVFVVLGGWFFHVVTVSNQSRRFRSEIAHMRGEFMTEKSTLQDRLEQLENAPPVTNDGELQFSLNQAERTLRDTEDALAQTEQSLADHQEALQERDAAIEELRASLDAAPGNPGVSPIQLSKLESERDEALHTAQQLRQQQSAYEAGLKEAHAHLVESQAFKVTADHVNKQIARMEQVWLDMSSKAGSCRNVLQDNLWVFWPDYIIKSAVIKSDLAQVGVNLLDAADTVRAHPQLGNALVDIAGWADEAGSIKVEAQAGPARTLLFVKLESPVFGIDDHSINEMYDQLKAFRAITTDQSASLNLDCILVAGQLEGKLKPVRVAARMGGQGDAGGPELVIRIVPVTYQALIKRAKQLQKMFAISETQKTVGGPTKKSPPKRAAVKSDPIDEPQAPPKQAKGAIEEQLAPAQEDDFAPDFSDETVSTQRSASDTIDMLESFRRDAHRDQVQQPDHDPVPHPSRFQITDADEEFIDVIDIEPEPEVSNSPGEKKRQPSRRATFLH